MLLILLSLLAESNNLNDERSRIESAVVKYSEYYGVDSKLVGAIIEIESSYNPRAVGSSHGEIGLMQLRPEFHSCASFEIEKNIACGTRYLAKVRRIKEPDWGCYWPVAFNYGPYSAIQSPQKTQYWAKLKRSGYVC